MSDDLPHDPPGGRSTDEVPGAPMVTSRSSNLPARMHPADVARHPFPPARRGFDPEEVRTFLQRVSQQLEAAERREQELLHELSGAEERARHPVVDEAVLSSALGQRSAAILRAAHDEAARIAQHAEEAAAALQREAQQHATDVQVNAESSAAERIAEAELEANAVRQQAREEAAAALDAARREGEVLLERAREHGKAMLEQAQEARRRVLTDMAQRRRMVTDQIEQFRAARDEVAGSVMGVRRSLDRIVEDLSRADDAARAAASAAPRPHRGDASDGELVHEAERAAAEIGTDSGAALAELAHSGEVLPHGAVSGPPGGAAGEEGDPDAGGPRVTLRFDDVASVTDAPGGLSAAEVVGAAPDTGGTAGGAGAGTGLGDPAGSEPDAGMAVEDEEVSVRVVARVPGGAGRPGEPGTSSTDVDDLFARLRARGGVEADAGNGTAPPEPAASAEPAPPVAAGAPGAVTGSGDPAGAHGDAGEAAPLAGTAADAPSDAVPVAEATELPPPTPEHDALAARSAALDPVVTDLARKLKRALRDDQNRLLDLLRQGPGEWSDDLLADEPAQRGLYAEVAAAPVRELVGAGIAFARSRMSGRQGRAPAPDQRTVDKITGELSGTVVTLLRRRLEGGDLPDAGERIGAAYREWRGERIERLAHDTAVDAFDAGVLAGAAKSRGVRWVRSDDGPGCADCEDNALAGAVPPGDAFPTGHRHPPAHAGCRCLLVPTPA